MALAAAHPASPEDEVERRSADVARVALLCDILKAEALSPRASADLARKAIERWT